MRPRQLARSHARASANEPRHRDVVMRCPQRRPHGLFGSVPACRCNRSNLTLLLQRKIRQDFMQRSRQHRLAYTRRSFEQNRKPSTCCNQDGTRCNRLATNGCKLV